MQLNLFNTTSNFHLLQDQLKKIISLGKKEGRSEGINKLYQAANLRVKNYAQKNNINIDDVRYKFALNIEKNLQDKKLTSKAIYQKSVTETFI